MNPLWQRGPSGTILRGIHGITNARAGNAGPWHFTPATPDPLADLEHRWWKLCRGNRAAMEGYLQPGRARVFARAEYAIGSLEELTRLYDRRWTQQEQADGIVSWYFPPLYRCERGGIADVWKDLPRDLLHQKIFDPSALLRTVTALFTGDTTMPEYSLIPASAIESVTALSKLGATARTEIAMARAAGDPVVEGLIVAEAMSQMRKLVTSEMLAGVMTLVGSPLGIECDKPEGYKEDIVRDAFIQAQLVGARPVNQEFGIIQRKFYPKKGFFRRAILEADDITDLSVEPGYIVRDKDSTALVNMHATWRDDGRLQKYDATIDGDAENKRDRRIRVKVNSGMGDDAIIGKAERKMYARLYEMITDNVLTAPAEDDDDTDTVEGTVTGAATEPGSDSEPTDEDYEASSTPAAEPKTAAEVAEFGKRCETDYGACKTAKDCDDLCDEFAKEGLTDDETRANLSWCLRQKTELAKPDAGKGSPKQTKMI